MPRPYTFQVINDIGAGASVVDILTEITVAKIAEMSLIEIFLNGEGVDVEASAKIGSDEVLTLGPVTVEATVGVLPSLRDDRVVASFAQAGDSVSISGRNSNAAAQELRAIVRVTAIGDVALREAVEKQAGLQGAA